MKSAFSAILGLLLLVQPVSAVVLVSGTGSGALDTLANPSPTFTYNLQGGGNVLVFGTYVDCATPGYSNVLFDGAAPTGTIQTGRGLLAYYYNPDASVDIGFSVALHGGNVNGGYFLYELNYVDTGILADLSAATGSITTTSNNRFVVDFVGNNFSNGNGLVPAPGSVITSSAVRDFNGASGGGALGHGTGTAGAAGLQTLGWTAGPGGTLTGEVSAAFAAAAGGPVPWNVNGGGNWSTGANWVGGAAPTGAEQALFGDVLTAPNAPATIALNVPVSIGTINFSSANAYKIAGPNALTLTGAATLAVGSGTHEISANIAGSAGLTKTGGGNLLLTGANTYSGTTNVTAGALQLSQAGAVPGAVSVGAAGTLRFIGNGLGGGYNAAFNNALSGDGLLALDTSLTTETVTRSAASTHNGRILIDGGTLAVSNATALGAADGTPVTQTQVNTEGGTGTGKLALSGNITVASELLILGPRRGDAANYVHLTSGGSNGWAGNIKGIANGDNYNIESTSGTLTIGGTISAPDGGAGIRNFIFSGAGNVHVDNKIVDTDTDENGDQTLASLDNEVNVHVFKRGAGTLTVSTATDTGADYWRGDTVIEGGKLEVISDGANSGELRSRTIQVRSGATFDIDHFGTYSLQVGQSLSGGGTVLATGKTLSLFDDNSVTPGDSGVGTLTVTGNMSLSDGGGGTGVLRFDLGDTPATVGGAENDLISISGGLTTVGAPSMTVSVTPADGILSPGSYRLISYTGAAVNVSALTPAFLDGQGNALTIRQSLAVTSATNQVNLTVTGTGGDLVWTGANGSAWDVNATQNWSQGGPQTFYDMDKVTFDDTADPGATTVNISTGNVRPSQANFTSAINRNYTITGTNGLGSTPINLTGNVVLTLQNTNALSGVISIAPTATLQLGGGSTVSGDITGTGALVINGGATLSSALTFDGPITVSSQVFPTNAGAFGTTNQGTTIATGANLWFNFVNLAVAEPMTFNGGQINVAGNDASGLALSGVVSVAAAGGTILVNPALGDDAVSISNNITGSAGGALMANVGSGSRMTVTGNITNNGVLTKTGAGVLAIGASTSITSPQVVVNGGVLDVTAQAALPLASGVTLAGNFGSVTGNVTAQSGATVRVGGEGMPGGTVYNFTNANWAAGGNTVVAADNSTPIVAANNTQPSALWSPRVTFGNGGSVLQGRHDGLADDAPTLKTTIEGLTPNQQYDVLVNYWTDGSGWQIMAGDSAGTLAVYNVGNSTNTNGLTYTSLTLTAEGNRTMWGAPLTLTANGSGQLEVFVDENSFNNAPRTWYDGISIASQNVVAQSFTITGNLAAQAGSTLAFDIAGPGVADLLTITGNLTVTPGFVLQVTLDSSVTPSALVAGNSWDLLNFASASGTFSRSNFILPTGLSPGLVWDTSQLLVNGTLSVATGTTTPGDFDMNGDVDGADFLLWQRNHGVGNLADWKANFGFQGGMVTPTATAIPEPGAVVQLLLCIVASAGGVRCRRSHAARVKSN